VLVLSSALKNNRAISNAYKKYKRDCETRNFDNTAHAHDQNVRHLGGFGAEIHIIAQRS
jgi:GrpB-like predicted nucleotidyltransferase (UPF0157 family)